nr:MAG TPA: Antifungal peptide termicin [Caudoviricetes sp.]
MEKVHQSPFQKEHSYHSIYLRKIRMEKERCKCRAITVVGVIL